MSELLNVHRLDAICRNKRTYGVFCALHIENHLVLVVAAGVVAVPIEQLWGMEKEPVDADEQRQVVDLRGAQGGGKFERLGDMTGKLN